MIPYAAAQTTRKSDGFDCTGMDTVLFTQAVGVIAAGGSATMTLQGSDTDVDGDYVDLYDANNDKCAVTILDGDDSKLLQLEIVRPIFKYQRYVITISTANVTLDLGWVTAGVHSRTLPVTRQTSQSHYGYESYISPGVQQT
jgi:hypothetical protein